jgi:HD-GYP domain-containing protein (c-di-GMP phosphodiesterase class II)
MDSFQIKTGRRIAMVSLALACVSSPVAWWMEREHAEDSAVAMAIEESQRLLEQHPEAFSGDPGVVAGSGQKAARALTGGLFDIAELYDRNGRKIAESSTGKGELIEGQVPSHGRPAYQTSFYESLELPPGMWVLRIFVPLHAEPLAGAGSVRGYFEGVRVIPEWQRRQMLSGAMMSAALVALAALLCGAVLYPVMVHLTSENRQKARDILRANISMMEALGRAVAKRDSDTGAHNYRVAWIASRIAEQFGFKGEQMQALIVGSFLHDIGKIAIPDAVLLKPGKLTDEEFDLMRTHVRQGEDIIGSIEALGPASEVVCAHHEKWDGSGYPRGLQGPLIPLSARIFAVADVYDALTSRRPYKEPMAFDDVMTILGKGSGHHFDPDVIRVFEPMASEIFQSLSAADESQCRQLLDGQLQRYFQVMS